MYSNKKNVLQLVTLLMGCEVQHIVVCPGSRNSPIVHSLANSSYFTCHSVVDERSAGFYALGIALHQGEYVAVCCTSGTAVLNLAPAVAEAYYQKLPLIVISADRPESWIDQMDGQTIPQRNVFGSLVKKFVHLPEVNTEEDEWHCNRLINEALLAARTPVDGPVHINIPISEPLFEFTEKELPAARSIHMHTTSMVIGINTTLADLADKFMQYKKRMFIVGQSSMGEDIGLFLEELTMKQECAVLREHLSNIDSRSFIQNFDEVLYALPKEKWAKYAPDLLITMGGHVISKRIKELIRLHPPKNHWHVSLAGEVVDTYQCLTDIVQCDEIDFLSHLKEVPQGEENKFSNLWLEASAKIPAPKASFSDLYVVNEFLNVFPKGDTLFLANSSTVRLAQLSKMHVESPRIYCNRGTNGIEGCVSTAIGYASVCHKDSIVYLITGDLAFFYDINSLWNKQINKRLRILLNNNGGGEIFYTLPKLNESNALHKYIAASHNKSAKAWAEAMGFTYLQVSDKEEFQTHLPTFMGKSDKPILMEVFSSKEENARVLREYYHSLKLK